jgi:hypothetical protein
MTEEKPSPEEKLPAERHGEWAAPVGRLQVNGVPEEAVNLNVEGRQVTTPMQGFGQMWKKTYRVAMHGSTVTPREVIHVWRAEFSRFWPEGNSFYKAHRGPIRAGDVAVLNLAGPGGVNPPGGAPAISTGILVIYADEESFSFLTPEGHMFAGMNTFSAYTEGGVTYAQIQALIRASDPLYEITFRLGFGHKMEDTFWKATLRNLAAHFGATAEPTLERTLIDARVQWREVWNIWQNAAVRTTLYSLGAPFRWAARKVRRK